MQGTGDLALMVRAGDYDRFLAIQLAPAGKRNTLYALTAFSIELANIASTVREPMLGHIRLAWWREALEEITSGKPPRQHPVTLALAEAYKAAPQSFAALPAMIDARAIDLDASLLVDTQSWNAYLDGTAGALHRAWALALDEQAAETHHVMIANEARAYATIGLVRAVPYLASTGASRFPNSWLEPYGAAGLTRSTGLPVFVRTLLQDLPAQTPHWPAELLALNGLSRLWRLYAQRLGKVGHDPYALPLATLRAAWMFLQIKYF